MKDEKNKTVNYQITEKRTEPRGKAIIKKLKTRKEMIVIQEILGPPKGLL
jgi:hypothetical protein